MDELGEKNVREFPVNTDLGSAYFGFESSSNLYPNRRYPYTNGWHGSTPYSALQIDDWDYRVRNDTNANGHWDDDRNGWLPPDGDDYFRGGSGHNIHMGSVDAPIGEAHVTVWSAGCQVIPGMANWTEFIENAWTKLNDQVFYFLVDVRDIHPPVWAPCEPDGSHQCPLPIGDLPATGIVGDTSFGGTSEFDLYNCSDADESGPEVMYYLTIDTIGTLSVQVDCTEPVDVDIHLLSGDDQNACLARDHMSLTYEATPGRYLIAVDTFVEGADVLDGEYTLSVTLD